MPSPHHDLHPYICDVTISFPTPRHAIDIMRVMQVDRELGDQIIKTFVCEEGSPDLTVHFAANQAKFLRVAVSSFYDYLSVALKCYQEFDDSLRVE